jgi:hypothetical protein
MESLDAPLPFQIHMVVTLFHPPSETPSSSTF